jgi:hypothetical protein
MKLKAFLLALCTAGFAVSIAVAATPAAVEHGKPTTGATTTGTTTGEHGKGKGHAKAVACKPQRKLVLHGEFVAAGAGGFAMSVKKGNHGAKGLAGKQVNVLVDTKTHFHGAKRKLEELAAGDRLVVQALACRADAPAGQADTSSILARKVGVKGPKADKANEDEKDEKDEQTTTGTSTEGTTTGTTTGS